MKKYLFGFFAVLFALPAFGVFTKAELATLDAEAGNGMELFDASTELCTELCGANGCSIDCENKTVSCTNAITASGVTLSNNEKKQKIEEHCKAFQPQSNTTDASVTSAVPADKSSDNAKKTTETTTDTATASATDTTAATNTGTTTLSGYVLDENDEPLIAAAVAPLDITPTSANSTITNDKGYFELKNVPVNQQYSISYIGYTKVTITPNENQTIKLKPNATLNEVTVEATWKSRACEADELAAINATSGHTARNANGNGVYCVPDDCAHGYTLNKKTNTCDKLNCESPRYKLNAAGDKCEDQVGKKCTATDANASKSEYVWENNKLKCEIKKCNKGYLPNDAGNACDVSEGSCTDAQVQQIEHATAGELKRGVCHATECDAGYEVSDGKCIAISGNCSPMPENATSAHREYDSTAGVEVCIIDACRDGYSVSNDKKSCIEPTLSQADAQKQIAELQENADAMREREQSLANRMVGGASMGAMGIGGMQVASALAEQNADADAEHDMAAYLATFKCDYGAGMTITGGETGIVLPGANVLLPIYNEYTTLAADLKTRKESLGMAPGIESEVILDAATSGLYDNVSTGITDGAYASISRALSNPTGADAAEWAAQRAETASQLTTGAIVAGAGALVGIAGNVLTNYVGDKPRESSDEILAKYNALKTLRDNTEKLPDNTLSAQCPDDATGTYPNCDCGDGKIYTSENKCQTCPGQLQPNEYKTKCECPNGTKADESNPTQCVAISSNTPTCTLSGDNVNTNNCTCINGFVKNADGTACECPSNKHVDANQQCTDTPDKPQTAPINLSTQHLFKLNEYTLTQDAKEEITTTVSTALKPIITSNKQYCITIVGKTDTTGDHINNLNKDLSEKRAKAVKEALVIGGIPEGNLKAWGVGSSDCKTSNPNGNDENCRVVTLQYVEQACSEIK